MAVVNRIAEIGFGEQRFSRAEVGVGFKMLALAVLLLLRMAGVQVTRERSGVELGQVAAGATSGGEGTRLVLLEGISAVR